MILFYKGIVLSKTPDFILKGFQRESNCADVTDTDFYKTSDFIPYHNQSKSWYTPWYNIFYTIQKSLMIITVKYWDNKEDRFVKWTDLNFLAVCRFSDSIRFNSVKYKAKYLRAQHGGHTYKMRANNEEPKQPTTNSFPGICCDLRHCHAFQYKTRELWVGEKKGSHLCI